MGFADFLFGSSPSSRIDSRPTATSEQQALLNNLIQSFQQDYFNNGVQVPGQNPLQTTSLAGLEELAMNFGGGQTTQTTQAAQGTTQDILGQGPRDINDYFQAAVADPLMEQFQEDIIPGIRRQFGGENFYGGERIRKEERATEDLLDSLTSARSQVAFEELGNLQNRQLQAAGLAPGLDKFAGGFEIDALSQLFGIGSEARGQQTELLDERHRRVQEMLALLGIPMTENIATVTGGSSGLLGGLASGAGSALTSWALG